MRIAVIAVILIAAIGIFTWYYFIDTLEFSQLVGRPEAPGASILLSLFDFDTGLTRYDIRRLQPRCEDWNRRREAIARIPDPVQRDRAEAELTADILTDPSMKKIVKKMRGFAKESALLAVRLMSRL